MNDVFLSYARKDRLTAERIAAAFQQRGWSVWWDRHIPTGRRFDAAIETAMNEARCVVVLWSEASVASDWVKGEAEEGKSRGILLPALIGDVTLPLEFRRLQTADLRGWSGSDGHFGFDQLVADVARMLEQPLPTLASPPRRRYGTIALVTLPTVLGLILVGALAIWRVPTPIRLKVVVSRAEFTVAARDAPLIRIWDTVRFETLSVERFTAVTVEAASIEVADPAQYNLALDRYPDSAWRRLESTGETVQFLPLDEMRLPSITIAPAASGGASPSTISAVTVPARSRVTLERAGPLGRSVTLRLAHRDPILALPVPAQVQLTAAQTRVTGLRALDSASPRASTFRFGFSQGSRPMEIRGDADSLVISVRLPPVPMALFSDGTIPIAEIDLTRQDALGNRVTAVAGDGSLGYAADTGAGQYPISASDMIALGQLGPFLIHRIALDPAQRGMHLEMEGIAGQVITSRGYVARDHRLTALQTVRRQPGWLALGLVAWAIPTAVGALRVTAARRYRAARNLA